MDKVGDPLRCEQSERATENEKFTVSEEILNFLVILWGCDGLEKLTLPLVMLIRVGSKHRVDFLSLELCV